MISGPMPSPGRVTIWWVIARTLSTAFAQATPLDSPSFDGRETSYAVTMSPKKKHELAREHLDNARSAIDEERLNDAVNALFYGGEAAVVSLADHYAINTKKNHGLKADAAAQLCKEGHLDHDFSPLLRSLNQARKDIWYEGDEPELVNGIETVADEVEELVDAAEKLA
jgi:uncharacterized protein (UPF0332 family)